MGGAHFNETSSNKKSLVRNGEIQKEVEEAIKEEAIKEKE